MSHSSQLSINKSDKTANKFRELGNLSYSKKNLFEALTLYNRSICFSNSKNVISLGYANRSAVFFEIGRYEECLKNIQWARENNYPKNKLQKLIEREEKCKKLILQAKEKPAEDPWDFFKLSYPANEKIPWIADCVEVRTTQKYGRGIYATKDLKAGDVICVDEPIIHSFKEYGDDISNAYYMHCYQCFKTCHLNLIPCVRTAALMFCSTECMRTLYSKGLNTETFMCDNVKMLSDITNGFDGKENFEDYVNHTDLKQIKHTIFDFNFNDPKDPKYKENLAKCLLALKSRDDYDLRGECLAQRHLSSKARNHILGIRPLNQQLTYYFNGDSTARYTGSSISLFVSLLNHSCVPNVHSYSVDNKVVVMVLKPIKAGEQLFRCYFNHILHVFDKIEMITEHKFICDCKACTDNEIGRFFPVALRDSPATFMSKNNFDKAKEYLNEGHYYINKNSKSPEEIYKYLERNVSIMDTLAYYCTFPC